MLAQERSKMLGKLARALRARVQINLQAEETIVGKHIFSHLPHSFPMSGKYKFHDKEGLYFVSFATVYWIDVFVREEYFQEMALSLDHCRRNKAMELYAWMWTYNNERPHSSLMYLTPTEFLLKYGKLGNGTQGLKGMEEFPTFQQEVHNNNSSTVDWKCLVLNAT